MLKFQGPMKKFYALLSLSAILLFIFNVVTRTEVVDTKNFSRASCALVSTTELIAADCLHPQKKYYLFRLPELTARDGVQCRVPREREAVTEGQKDCATYDAFWGPQLRWPEIGWDAYSVWYTRAVALWKFSAHEWRPALLLDRSFLRSLPSPEHEQYPWLLPLLYSGVLSLQGSASPLGLTILNVLVFLLGVFLWRDIFRETKYPHLWWAFAFCPIGGRFLFHLYADIWVVTFLLAFVWAYQRQRWIVAAILLCLVTFLKQEAFLHAFLVLLALGFQDKFFKPWRLLFGTEAMATLGLKVWQKFAVGPVRDYFTPLKERLVDPVSYTERLPQILKYFSDVFFRPGLWGFLSLTLVGCFMMSGIRSANKKLWWRQVRVPLVLTAALVAAITLAYLSYPHGAYREVVLTGANRALWPALVLSFVLYFRPVRNA